MSRRDSRVLKSVVVTVQDQEHSMHLLNDSIASFCVYGLVMDIGELGITDLAAHKRLVKALNGCVFEAHYTVLLPSNVPTYRSPMAGRLLDHDVDSIRLRHSTSVAVNDSLTIRLCRAWLN